MNKRKALVLVLVGFCSLFLGGKGAYAAVSSATMADKVIYAGVVRCFENKPVDGGMIEKIEVEEFKSADSLAKPDKTIVPMIGKNDSKVSCADLISKRTSKKIENVENKTNTEKGKILSGSGYRNSDGSNAESDGYCFEFPLISASKDFSDEKISRMPRVCVKDNGKGYVFSGTNGNSNYSRVVYYSDVSDNKITIAYFKPKDKVCTEFASTCRVAYTISKGDNGFAILADLGNKVASAIGSGRQTNSGNMVTDDDRVYYAACSNYSATSTGITCKGTEYDGGKNADQFSYKYSAMDLTGSELYEKTWTRDGVIASFSGSKYGTLTAIQFNDNEKYSLYYHYLKDVYGISDMLCNDTAGEEWDGGGRTYKAKLWWAEGKKYTTCAFNVSQANAKVNGVGDDGIFGVPMSLKDMISALDGLNPTGEPTEYVAPSSMNDTGSEDAEATCLNTAGASGLGWILCPILDLLNGATDDIYSNTIEPNLQIEPALFQGSDEDSSVRDAWNSFRDIANVFFIIMLLIVIFSQLTGIGIDNYGIKKILPKMLVAAVLINLSYLVCLLLVDVSNIVGNGFMAMFEALGTGLNASVDFTVDGVVAGSLTSIGILGAAAAGAISMLANPAILLSLFVSALGVFVGVFLLFILLSARKAVIIVLTVISPLAVVAYMLPNTKKMFDKWWNAFAGLLLVYPIASLAVGAGDYISKLLLTVSNNYFGALTAMIAGIAPVFFIPMLLKGSFSALGKVGGAIAGFGAGARQGFGKFARGTDAYKNLQERGMAAGARWRAGVDSSGKQNDLNAFGRFIRGGNRGIAGARSQYLADVDKRNKENSLMGAGFAAKQLAQQKEVDASEVANYMTLINDATRNGADEDRLVEEFNKYAIGDGGNMNKNAAIAALRIAGRRKDTAAKFMQSTLQSGDASKKYSSEMLSSMGKEIAEGGSAANFMAASPLGFEYASQLNKGGDAEGKSYEDWRANSDNVKDALNRYITNSNELVGTQKGSLNEIAELMENGMPEKEASRIRQLAIDTINNRRANGVWDSTKAEQIYRIAGMKMEGGTSNNGPSTGGGVLLTGKDAKAAFDKGRSDGTIVLPK